MNISVWTVSLSHRHGADVHAFDSQPSALSWLADYCERWWDEVPDDLEMPPDLQKRIEVYFENVADEIAKIEGHSLEIGLPTDALIREALAYEADAFDNDEDVNGADLVDWFGEWRQKLKAFMNRAEDTQADSAFEIQSILVASTAHIGADEAKLLTEADYEVKEHGWLFAILTEDSDTLREIDERSEGLGGVIQCARENCCGYVLLDPDGSQLPNVKTYDW